MARLAFIGDCHLGFRHRLKSQRLHDYARAFEDSVSKALALRPDAIVFLGDLVHHSRPDPVSLRTVLKSMISAAQSCPIIVCIGNHEIEGHLGTTYSPIYGDVHKDIHVLTSENPYFNLNLGGKSYGFHGFEYTRSKGMAEEKLRRLSDNPKADVNILCLHQAIERYLTPYEISLSCLSQVASKYDFIISGHVHKHQQIGEVSDLTAAFYCGSTERISFNEAKNKCGFLFVADDFKKPTYVEVSCASMAYVREEFKGTPKTLNDKIEAIISSHHEKLLKIEVVADLEGDMMDVRRDWSAFDGERTILDVSIAPKTQENEVKLERIELSEELISEYFQKTGNKNKELENLCIELYRKYAN